MAQYVENDVGPAIAGAALPRYSRCKFDGNGRLVAAGLTDRDLGTNEIDAFADGDVTNIRYRNARGTRKVIANGAITKGADIYTAASGKLSATNASTSFYWGTAMEAAGQDGDIFEALPCAHGAVVP
jgi:hypothetical protein